MLRFIHSLRFQLPAVLLGLFVLILGLWMLLFREISSITGKTKALTESAEASDRVGEWVNHVTMAARERTKFMTLSKPGYLEGFLAAAQEFENSYASITQLIPVAASASGERLRASHLLNLEYQNRAQAYVWEWHKTEKVEQNLRLELQKTLAVTPPKKSMVRIKPIRITKNKPNSKALKTKNTTYSRAAFFKFKAEQYQANAGLNALLHRKHSRDSLAAESFKSLENRLREGLQTVQGELLAERKDKQDHLRATIARAKKRLLYSMILLTLMVSYVAYILQWKILAPLSLLENGAVQIGRGDLNFRVDVQTQSEIGELAKVFNTMSEKLIGQRENELHVKRLDAIQQVVRSMNHEINNPLMIISGNAEYLLSLLQTEDKGVEEKLNTIIAEVRRIFLVTQQLREIKDLVSANYTSEQDKMIDLARSSQVIKRAW
jgi:HAMP domain-containing protein